MCGICGVLNFQRSQPVDQTVVRKMTGVMTHRGPDDDGYYFDGPLGFGFRRLSIVDLAGGHQPMSNETGDVWIIFNGEIYNHADIRKDLIAQGHQYRTKADTETIIHLYEQEGVAGFSRMNGMFGLAIWDAPRKRLVIARDRLGIKPIHYTIRDGSLCFASEIKALLQNPAVPARPNSRAFEEQLIFRYPAGEDSLFEGVAKLLPGHLLICENGRIRTEKFWDVCPPGEYGETDLKSATEQLEANLRASVKYRLMSDVPLGTFCSGGVDSGLTTAFAKDHHNADLNTFSIGFHEPEWDESRYATMMADRFQTNHHVIRIDKKKYADALPFLVWHHDEPLHHPSSPLIYFVSKLARQYVTVVLTGDGSDESFGGYPRFLIPRTVSHAAGLPGFVRKALGAALSAAPGRKLNKMGYFLGRSLEDVGLYNAMYGPAELVRSILATNTNGEYLEYRRSILRHPSLSRHNLTEQTMYLDLKTYIPSALYDVDRMTMAVSIEGRVPFLDHRLVEWAIKLPLSLKINGTRNKYLVKLLGEQYLPHEAIYRQKVGFGVPVDLWFRDNDGLGRYLDMFFEPKFRQREGLRAERVQAVIKEHRAGTRNHGELLWTLTNLELWHRIYIDRTLTPEPPRD
ncbi:MAG: asparagine synthase (glutamine-hydrolyzing) [Candidatus Zixiibacteriota bacterium]